MAALLVIDDEPGVLEFLALVLRQAGHTVVTADNGREAFRILHQSPVDLVLTDIYMPEQDGIELVQRVRSQFPEIKLIAISGGVGGESLLEAAGRLGADAALSKPVTSNDLIKTVAQVLQCPLPSA
ncbi:MAG: response regulator [Nitrospiraceae bacterium]|nr:response regulator [Nitrospiraceae bacterium]